MAGKHLYQREKYKLNYIQSKISKKILNDFLKKYNYIYLKKNYLEIINNINYEFKINKQEQIYTLSKLNSWINNKKYLNKKKYKKEINLKLNFENKQITDDDNLIIDELLTSSKLKSVLPIL